MKQLSALPTWVLVNLTTIFLPHGHPWHNRWFTLDDWYHYRTELTREYDQVIWVFIAIATILLASHRY